MLTDNNLPGSIPLKIERYFRPPPEPNLGINFSERDFRRSRSREYKLWVSGVNPKTNRKITVGGDTHKKVGSELGFTNLHEIVGVNPDEFYQEREDKKAQHIELLERYRKMKSWYDYITIDGEHYNPIGNWYDGIHTFQDCGGRIIYETEGEIREIPYECNGGSSFGNGCRCGPGGCQGTVKVRTVNSICTKCKVIVDRDCDRPVSPLTRA